MFRNYLLTVWKVMGKNVLFTSINLFGISFTLLILIVVTALFDHVIGPGQPETKLDRMLSVFNVYITNDGGDTRRRETRRGNELSYYFLNRYVKSLRTPEKVTICSFHEPVDILFRDKKFTLDVMYTDSEFWEIMDFSFIEGKNYNRSDVENIKHVVVINEATRQKLFPDLPAIGHFINIGSENYQIVGVVENIPILRILSFADVWIPLTQSKEDFNKATLVSSVNNWHARILARKKSDIPLIKKEFKQKLSMLDYPEGRFNKLLTGADTFLEDLSRHLFIMEDSDSKPILLLIFLLITLFMVLPVLNLVNINISRIMERSTEIGIRKTFGASSLTLVGQFLIENIVITFTGGMISLFLGSFVLLIINQSGIIKYAHLALNYRIVAYSMLIWLFFALFSGVYPAYRMSRMHPIQALRGGKS